MIFILFTPVKVWIYGTMLLFTRLFYVTC